MCRLLLIASCLALLVVGPLAYAQPLPLDQSVLWTSRHHDAANSSSTSVELPLGGDLVPWWTGPNSCQNQPIIFTANVLVGGDLVSRSCTINGPHILDAWSGSILKTLTHGVDDAAASSDPAVGVLLTWSGSGPVAYDLLGGDFASIPVTGSVEITYPITTPRGTDFFILGRKGRAARISCLRNGAVVSAQVVWHWYADLEGIPVFDQRAGAVSSPTPTEPDGIFYLPLGGFGNPGGIVALDAATGALRWSDLAPAHVAVLGVSVAAEGYVYAAIEDYIHTSKNRGYYAYYIRVYDSDGVTLQDLPTNRLCFGPPTLATVNGVPLMFASTSGGWTYAWNRNTLEPVWSRSLPISSYAPPAYAAGKLYLTDHITGQLYVLGADLGDTKTVYQMNGSWGGSQMPAIGTVTDPRYPDTPLSVMCLRAAWPLSTQAPMTVWGMVGKGPTPPPPVPYALQLAAQPTSVHLNSSSTITATLTQGGALVRDVTISFSCNAGNNQGFVSPTSAVTDQYGVATTTYRSQGRTGPVTITASDPLSGPASVVVTVVK